MVPASVYKGWSHRESPRTWGDNFSNNDFDTDSQSLKGQEVNLKKWTLSIPPLAQAVWPPRDKLNLGLSLPWKDIQSKSLRQFFTLDQKPMGAHSVFLYIWEQSSNDTSGVADILGWQGHVLKWDFKSTVKSSRDNVDFEKESKHLS